MAPPLATASFGSALNRLRAGTARLILANPLYARSLRKAPPETLVFFPRDIRHGDPDIADQIFQGRYRFAGQEVVARNRVPWRTADADTHWHADLHSFFWLQDFCSTTSDTAARHARALILSWAGQYGAFDHGAWATPILARRLWAFLTAADFLLNGAEKDFSARFLDVTARQARHLFRIGRYGLPTNPAIRLQVAQAGLLAAFALPGQRSEATSGLKVLEQALKELILDDGCHIDRNPLSHAETFGDLLALRHVFGQAEEPVPEPLQHAIDRMAPALRFFRHGDGALALFNGAREGTAKTFDYLLDLAASKEKPPPNLIRAGFQRMSLGRSLLLVDTGQSRFAGAPGHAAPLAFEFSTAKRRVFVNCGAPERPSGPWGQAFRSTAAHTSLVVGDANAIVQGGEPAHVYADRQATDDGLLCTASHDGYASRFGLTHRRRLYLTAQGDELIGEDILAGTSAARLGVPFTIRFHLHPEVEASLLQTGTNAILRLSNSLGYKFSAEGANMAIEDSLYLGINGARTKTQQLVLSGLVGGAETRVAWSLVRIPG